MEEGQHEAGGHRGQAGEGLPRLPHSTSPRCSAGSVPKLWGDHVSNLTLGTEGEIRPSGLLPPFTLKWGRYLSDRLFPELKAAH